jgi:hypothetical protein
MRMADDVDDERRIGWGRHGVAKVRRSHTPCNAR